MKRAPSSLFLIQFKWNKTKIDWLNLQINLWLEREKKKLTGKLNLTNALKNYLVGGSNDIDTAIGDTKLGAVLHFSPNKSFSSVKFEAQSSSSTSSSIPLIRFYVCHVFRFLSYSLHFLREISINYEWHHYHSIVSQLKRKTASFYF